MCMLQGVTLLRWRRCQSTLGKILRLEPYGIKMARAGRVGAVQQDAGEGRLGSALGPDLAGLDFFVSCAGKADTNPRADKP